MEDDVAALLKEASSSLCLAKAWYEALRPSTVRARRWEEANALAQLAATQRVQVGERTLNILFHISIDYY